MRLTLYIVLLLFTLSIPEGSLAIFVFAVKVDGDLCFYHSSISIPEDTHFVGSGIKNKEHFLSYCPVYEDTQGMSFLGKQPLFMLICFGWITIQLCFRKGFFLSSKFGRESRIFSL